MPKTRLIPNPSSCLLRKAIVGGAGLGLPPGIEAPPGMGMVLLYVPLEELTKRAPPDLQTDLGLPWASDDGKGVWFDELSPGI